MSLFRRGVQHSARSSDWALFERFEIPNFDNPEVNYLVRYRIVQTPWFSIFLHRIGTPDSRTTLHDHPWSFTSLILRGGYSEYRLDPLTREAEVHHVKRLNVMRRDDAHSILQLDRTPTWTLVLTGKRRRTWGYWRYNADSRNSETWTPFDTDEHSEEFARALERRSSVK